MKNFLDRTEEVSSQLVGLAFAEAGVEVDSIQEANDIPEQECPQSTSEGLVLRNMDFRMAGLRIFLPDDFCSMSVSARREICEGAVADGEIHMVDVNPIMAAHLSTSDITSNDNRYSRFGWKFTPFVLDKSLRSIKRMGSIWPVFKRILFCPECGTEKEYTHHEVNVLRKQTRLIFLECGICKEKGKAVQLKVKTYRQQLSEDDRYVFKFLATEVRNAVINNENVLPRIYVVYSKIDAPQVQWAPSGKEEEELFKKAESKGRTVVPLHLCLNADRRIEDIRITTKHFQAGWLYKRELFREFCIEKYGWSRAFKALRFSKFGNKIDEEEL